jgi:hypothetical protein
MLRALKKKKKKKKKQKKKSYNQVLMVFDAEVP